MRRLQKIREERQQARASTKRIEVEKVTDVEPLKADFVKFCEALRIVPKDTQGQATVPLRFNAIQQLFHIERSGRDVVLKPRQIGFTTLELARDLWLFLCREGSRVTVVYQSTSDNGPGKLLSTILSLMIESLRKAGWPITFVREAWNEWTLPNGNLLKLIPSGASEASADKKGRSGTITRLHITECAFYDYADATLNALLECVPGPETGSEIVIESTPNGAAGLFYDYCQAARKGASGFKFHFFPWFLHAEYQTPANDDFTLDEDEQKLADGGVTLAQLNWRRRKIAEKRSKLKFDQEYPSDPDACFIVSGSGYFDQEQIASQQKVTREPLELRSRQRVRIYAPPKPGASYLLALDPSEGIGGDPCAGIMLDRKTGEHVASIDGQFTPGQLAKTAAKLGTEYNVAQIVPERNNHGHAVIQALTKEGSGEPPFYANIYVHDDDERLGFPTNPVTRPQILSELEDSFRDSLVKTPDAAVLSQLRTFVILKGKPQGAPGTHDDLVMAYAIGWFVRGRVSAADRFVNAMNAFADRQAS